MGGIWVVAADTCRCPFSWWAFVMVGGAATALVAPFVWRAIRRLLVHDGRDAAVSQDESAHGGNVIVFPRCGRSPLTHETKSYLTLFPVSAAFGCNLKSRQPGRVIRYNKRFARDSRYCSWASLVKTGDLFGADFCYRELPLELDPFDCVAYDANPMEFHLSDSERFSR